MGVKELNFENFGRVEARGGGRFQINYEIKEFIGKNGPQIAISKEIEVPTDARLLTVEFEGEIIAGMVKVTDDNDPVVQRSIKVSEPFEWDLNSAILVQSKEPFNGRVKKINVWLGFEKSEGKNPVAVDSITPG